MPTSSFKISRASAGDFDACRELLREGSKSFHAASLLLPSNIQPSVRALYAFCRVADDAVDLAVEGDGASAVARLRSRLDLVYAGTPRQSPVDRAFAATVAKHALPRTLLDALIEGFEWDVAKRRYQTLSDVRAYAARVAASVGAMMTVLMDAASPEALARACDLGVAMQLTNIARDVGEDARAGRLYLPLDWFKEAGIDPDEWLQEPRFEPAIARMTARLLEEADVLYRRAGSGIAMLPGNSRIAIWAARHIYADIGSEIERRGFDSVNGRSFVSKTRKVMLLGKAVASRALDRSSSRAPALAETTFLVEAAHRPVAQAQQAGFRSRLIWTLDLFERLERAERARLNGRKTNVSTA